MKVNFYTQNYISKKVYNKNVNPTFGDLYLEPNNNLIDNMRRGASRLKEGLSSLFAEETTVTKAPVKTAEQLRREAQLRLAQEAENRRRNELYEKELKRERRIQKFKNIAEDIKYAVSEAFAFVAEKTVDASEATADFFKYTLPDFFSRTKDVVADNTVRTKEIASDIAEATGEVLSDAKTAIADWTARTKTSIKMKLKEKNSDLKEKATTVAEKNETKVQEIEAKLSPTAEKIEAISTSVVEGVQNYSKKSWDWIKKGVGTLNDKITDLTVSKEKEIEDLENKFRRGGRSYLPHKPMDPFNPEKLIDIVPREKYPSFKKEFKRLCDLYLKNTVTVDNAALGFNGLSRNLYSTFAQSLKEIFALGSETKALDSIPKLGFVTKTLRFAEQTRLVYCLKQDYQEVTNWYVKDGMVPIINKYNGQLDVIKAFVSANPSKAKLMKQEIDTYMKKLEKARNSRMGLCSKLMASYATAGANFNKVCNTKTAKEAVRWARKAATTFMTL